MKRTDDVSVARSVDTSATSHTDAPPEIREDEQTVTRPSNDSSGVTIQRPGMLLAAMVLSAGLAFGSGATTTPALFTALRRRYEIAEASTAAAEVDQELLERVRELFDQGSFDFFQDGLQSTFSRHLVALLAQHGRDAFRAIAEYLFSGDAGPDIMSEALRWLVEVDDPSTLSQRWSILLRTLQDTSPKVRDGAILGFAALDDPRATPFLVEARNVEQIAELRRLIDQVLAHLSRA
jgi:hypothetical protein